jgi:hypothetical protein
MDKLTQKIKTLNDVYDSFRNNYINLRKLFPKQCNVNQKVLMSERFLFDAFMLIKDYLETEAIDKDFTNIIKGVKNVDKKRRE